MAERLTPDLCILGADPGGLATATAGVAAGASVVLVEPSADGANPRDRAEPPLPALRAAAGSAQALRESPLLAGQRPAIDFGRARAQVAAVGAAQAPDGARARLVGLGVRVLAGVPRFKDERTIAVGEEVEIVPRTTVVATGSSPVVPAIPGLEDVHCLTPETVADLTQAPEHLIVVGSDATALELAQAHRRLGAAVTLLASATPLAAEDPECATIVLDQLRRDGMVVRDGITVTRVEARDAKVVVILGGEGHPEETIEGSHLLLSLGGKARLDGLALDLGGIRHEDDRILVDAHLRTTNQRVYAIGTAAGLRASEANHHAGLVIRNALFGVKTRLDETVVPHAVFTDPELAHVGLTEAQARQRDGGICVLRAAFHHNARAVAERRTRGHVKVITTQKGQILGATIVGVHAGELIATWTLAIAQGLNIRAIADLALPHPTLSETGTRAASGFFLQPTRSRPGRLLRWLRRFG